jgi:hypothetical protein
MVVFNKFSYEWFVVMVVFNNKIYRVDGGAQ